MIANFEIRILRPLYNKAMGLEAPAKAARPEDGGMAAVMERGDDIGFAR
jgi:hypothetical protein